MSDDLGFRTGPKKKRSTSKQPRDKRESGKRKREKRETGKHKRETGKHKRETGKHKRETGKHKRETGKHKRETGKHKREKPAVADSVDASQPVSFSIQDVLPLGLVLGVLTVIGVGLMAFLGNEDEPEVTIAEPARIQMKTQAAATAAPRAKQASPLQTRNLKVNLGPKAKAKPIPVGIPKAKPKEDDALEALRKKSSTHAAIARVLDELKQLFDPSRLRAPGPNYTDFAKRRQREKELIAQLRAMGPLAVGALKDMVLGLNNRHHRIFLGKALAGIEGPEAQQAVAEILGKVKDIAVQTSVVRNLPNNEASAQTVADAFKNETNSTLRSMLLREYGNRAGRNVDTDVFREAAKDKDINVRATAVTLLGRRGDPRDQQLLEDIIKNEKSLMIRQKAILSYALTGKKDSLNTLDVLARNPQSSLAIRASAVLAISRVGGQRAIDILSQLATSDPHAEIRRRAQLAAANLQRSQQRKRDPKRDAPLRVQPGANPVEK